MPLSVSPSPKVPIGYRLLRLETTDSTNAEARRRVLAGEPGPLWIVSSRQRAGRGRAGRAWQSQSGNLFASLLITLECPLRIAGQLALLAGIVTFDTVAKLVSDEARSKLLLKWPNDVLIGDSKVAGILLESVSKGGRDRCVVVIGTGINLANHPANLGGAATSLATHGATIAPEAAFETLANFTDHWLSCWDEGAYFGAIREAWLERAGPTGRPIRVRLHHEETEGVFAGLDSAGALRLVTRDGAERRIAAGDVFFPSA